MSNLNLKKSFMLQCAVNGVVTSVFALLLKKTHGCDIMIQFWVALDGNNRITINKALRGKEYECLECHGKMIPKKGEIKAWHFAHKSDFSCDGEGQKHLYIKELIYEVLTLDSTLSNQMHKKWSKVRMEKRHLGLIPDVCIHWRDGDYLAIEVCDTSKASEDKIQLYGDNMIEFDISAWGEEEVNNPFFVLNEIYSIIFFKLNEREILKIKQSIQVERNELRAVKQKVKITKKKLDLMKKYFNGGWSKLDGDYKIKINHPCYDLVQGSICKIETKAGSISWVEVIEVLSEDNYGKYINHKAAKPMEIGDE